MTSRIARALLASLVLAAVPFAQGGWRKFDMEDLGIAGEMAKDYVDIPVQPLERWIIAQWAEELPERERDRKQVRPELELVWIDHVQRRPTTGEDEGEGEDDEEVETGIGSLGDYVEARFRGWVLDDPEDEVEPEDAGDYELHEYVIVKDGGSSKVRRSVFAFESPDRTIAFLGVCHDDDFADQHRIWRKIAEETEFSEPEAADLEKLRRHYDRNPEFVDPEYRIGIRQRLVRGWDFEDTENYILVFSTRDEPLIRRLKSELEAIRAAYEELFPPLEPIQTVSTVRICRDLDEYTAYGGPAGSGGYWHPLAEELVFFDYDSLDRPGRESKGTENAQIVLYHEAFHQYIHYACGQMPPHTWFNEGTADYFSGALVKGGKVKRIEANPWRVETIQDAVQRNSHVPWEEILLFSKAQYYSPQIRSLCYAQGWSMVYFLNESRDVKRNDQWEAILPTYFETFRTAAAEEVAEMDEEAGWQERQAAGQRAATKAYEAAFDGVDIGELEEAWTEFVLDLDVPD